MIPRSIAGAILGIGAFAMTSGSVHHARTPYGPLRGEDHDSRRRTPGTHRAGPAELAVRDRVAAVESAKLRARRPDAASVPATTWVSLGPSDAFDEFNGYEIEGVDSGRPNGIGVDPRDPNVVYMAVSGGGLWKTFDFSSATPHWNPLSDTLPNLAIGAFAMDPANPDTLYIGNGDFVDASGDTIMKSTDAGGTWSAPVELGAAGAHPGSIRGLGAAGNVVLAGTDVGLFASTDGGATFALVTLPNPGNAVVPDAMWSIANTGGTHWVATGLTFCDATTPPPIAGGTDPGGGCTAGNDGVIWYSADGASWQIATTPLTTGIGRITVSAGGTADPAHTTLYAMVGSVDGFTTTGFWRSGDGGMTWTDATGTLAAPSIGVDDGSGNLISDCEGMDLGHDQSWYNQAVVVDPTNPDHVLVGGNLCGARTLNGTSASPSWELISHWLPNPDSGATANGLLPYVHADWHTAYVSQAGGTLTVFAGTDGGLFSSTNLWDPATPSEQVSWTNHNHGLVTHLIYQVASGDPATQNPFVLFGGLQDNGTRFRADPSNPSVFDQPVGGDGIGATVHVSSSGTTYWASAEFTHAFCQQAAGVDCALGSNWNFLDPSIDLRTASGEQDDDDDNGVQREHGDEDDPRKGRDTHGEDTEPFFVHYANVETDTTGQSVLTHTDGAVWVASASGGTFTWTAISQDLSNDPNGEGFASVTASRVTPGLYGAAGAVSLAPFFVTTKGNTKATWTAAKPVQPTGTTDRLTGASSIDFPPTLPAGKNPGDVYVGAFTGTLNDAARTPPPDNEGHLYRTEDGGKTWTTLVGADPAHQLPNVAVYVVKYDPVVATTLYAGTDLGVYFTIDDGATWNRMGDGFPLISARDLYVAKNQDFIRVATYGRGMWEIYPSAAANMGVPGNGDFDRNLKIDWIDLAAMSARLGDTPATTAAPLYTWIDDLVGAATTPTGSIDDADLTALITSWGNHP